jgi:hypothetical protein
MNELPVRIIQSLIQITLSFIIIFVPWEILYDIVQRKGSNWMWVLEMKLYFSAIIIIILIGNFIRRFKYLQILGFQLTVIFLLYGMSFSIRPYRSLYLLVCGLTIILIGFFIDKLVKRFLVK